MMAMVKDGMNFFENLNTSKLAMPRLITPACFSVIVGDECFLFIIRSQADQPDPLYCSLLFKVCLVFQQTLVKAFDKGILYIL